MHRRQDPVGSDSMAEGIVLGAAVRSTISSSLSRLVRASPRSKSKPIRFRSSIVIVARERAPPRGSASGPPKDGCQKPVGPEERLCLALEVHLAVGLGVCTQGACTGLWLDIRKTPMTKTIYLANPYGFSALAHEWLTSDLNALHWAER